LIVEGRGRQGKGLDDDFHPRRPTSPKFQDLIDLVLRKKAIRAQHGQATRVKAQSSTPNIHEGARTGLPTTGLLQYWRDTSTVHSLTTRIRDQFTTQYGTLATTDHGRQKSLSIKEIRSHIRYTYAKTTPLHSIRRSFASSGRLEAGASQFRRERVWKASGEAKRGRRLPGARDV